MSSPNSEAKSKKTYRVAALSVVKHGYLARAVAAHPRFELAVVADDASQPDWVHERNEAFAREFDLPYRRDVDKALSDYDIDAAVISSQAERHCELGHRAVEAGHHIILDKPMSTKLSECESLARAVHRSKVKCLIWNRNFLPSIVQAMNVIESGALGPLYAIHCDFYFSKDAGPPKGSRREGAPPINWLERQIEAHADGSDGGVGEQPIGELQVEGIYPLSYIRMLTGMPVKRVFARTAAHFHQAHVDNNVDDLATVTLEMDVGMTASLCIGRIGAASHPDIGEIKLHVLGAKGGLVISEARPEIAVYYRDQPPKEFKHQRVANENDFLLMDNFAAALDNGSETVLNAEGGRDICAIVEAAIESSRTGKLVDVTEFKP